MGQIKKKAAMELTFPKVLEEILSFPTLHILFERMPDGTLAGHCLDFDTWAYTEESDPSIATDQVVRSLLEMALLHYTRLYQRRVLDRLYDNEVEDLEVWKEYRSLMRTSRAASLKATMDRLFEKAADKSDLEGDQKESERFDLSDLTPDETQKVRAWLSELADGTPEQKSEIILAMMDSLVRIRPKHLRLAV